MTLTAWQALLARLRDRLESLGVTLHEIEESSQAGAASPAADAAYWLERAETIVVQRQAVLEELTAWMTRVGSAAASQIPALVPSVGDCVRWASTALDGSTAAAVPSDVRSAVEAAKEAPRI